MFSTPEARLLSLSSGPVYDAVQNHDHDTAGSSLAQRLDDVDEAT